jgi:hypothetical protein
VETKVSDDVKNIIATWKAEVGGLKDRVAELEHMLQAAEQENLRLQNTINFYQTEFTKAYDLKLTDAQSELEAAERTITNFHLRAVKDREVMRRYEAKLVEADKRISELEHMLTDERAAGEKVWNRMKTYSRALNEIGILGSGETAYTREFTERVNQIVNEALDIKKPWPY